MPRRRPKGRVDHLVDALAAAEALSSALAEIDLEDVSRDVRVALASASRATDQAGKKVAEALRKDVPSGAIGGYGGGKTRAAQPA